MSRVYDHYEYIYNAGIVFRRQIMTSKVDLRTVRDNVTTERIIIILFQINIISVSEEYTLSTINRWHFYRNHGD